LTVTVEVEVEVVEVELELDVLLVVVEEDGVVEVALVVLELVLLVVLEDESTRTPPMATMTIIMTAPITKGAETPRLVRICGHVSLGFYIRVHLDLS